jgi:SET domain
LPYEIRPSLGKGLGVFATKDIPRGTSIMIEEPLFTIKTPEMIPGQGMRISDMLSDMDSAFDDLDSSQQEAYLALHAYRFPSEEEEPNSNTIMVIFRSNAYDTGDHQAGIFPKIARINHSCKPNSGNHWSQRKKKRNIYAAREIKKGEEITVSYIPLLKTTAERQTRLAQYGFTRDCEACQSQDNQSDERRKEISSMLEILQFESQRGNSEVQNELSLESAIALIEMVEEEGLTDYYERCYHLAAEFHRRQGNMIDAMGWAMKELEMLLFAEESSKDIEEVREFIEALE